MLAGCSEASRAGKPTTLDDLNDPSVTIGGITGSVHEPFIAQVFPRAREKQFNTFSEMITALESGEIDAFVHAKDNILSAMEETPGRLRMIDEPVGEAMAGMAVSPRTKYPELKSQLNAFLKEMAIMDYNAGWTQQFHYGAIRNNNTKMFNLLGADTGFDSIGEFTTAKACSHFLDELNVAGKLTKTILYNLNPCANEVLATMLGNFQDGSCPGKIQWGSGWWFLDQKDGMEKQMNALSLLGLLSRFVGMLTDSRSFLSYPRHEYFRRTMCNLLGNDIEKGLIPFTGYEEKRVRQMVEDICYNNAKNYFQF